MRASFLNDSKALSETVGLLRAADCTSEGVEAFRRAVERYNSSGIDLNVSAFPSLRQGFYSFGSMSQLVAALPHKLCDTKHPYEFNCFDTVIAITADRLRVSRRDDEIVGPILVPNNKTNGQFKISTVFNAKEAFMLAYPIWYRQITEGTLPKSTGDSRRPLTAALLRCHTLSTNGIDKDVGRAVIDSLRASWKRQGLGFPKNVEVVLCHEVSVPKGLLCTAHAGVLVRRERGYTYLEKAGGSGPFVRLDIEDRSDLFPWLSAIFEAGKFGYTHHFATFNDTTISPLEVNKPQ
ncbi:MAG TPA: hypothetical protein VKM56_04355 [Verrucomicrobiae bacterium]|nr:hypothetical protein [Verrucomicrobiae bacterium]